MRDDSGSRCTAKRSGRARPPTPWRGLLVGLPILLAASLSPVGVEGQLIEGESEEALVTLTVESVQATFAPRDTPSSTRLPRELRATPTPTITHAPLDTRRVAPTRIAPSPEPPRSVADNCDSSPMSSLELDLFDSINHERLQRGVVALRDHACGRLVAEVRAVDMATLSYFSHQGPDGATASSLLRAQLEYSVAGENLARNNYPSDQSVDVAIESLMESKLHRIVILDRSYSHLGVALSEDEAGMKYYVMIFIAF